MEILFGGICLMTPYDRAGNITTDSLLGLVPKMPSHGVDVGSGHGGHGGPLIPISPHTVFILAPQDAVDYSKWGGPPNADFEWEGARRLRFDLVGDDVTFDPAPQPNGTPSLASLPRVEGFCGQDMRVRRDAIIDAQPRDVIARIWISGGSVTSFKNKSTAVTRLIVDDGTRVQCRSFGNGFTRELSFTPSPTPIHIANVVLPDFFNGIVGTHDGHHSSGFCVLMEPDSSAPGDVLEDVMPAPTPNDSRINRATLAGGCSNSTWP